MFVDNGRARLSTEAIVDKLYRESHIDTHNPTEGKFSGYNGEQQGAMSEKDNGEVNFAATPFRELHLAVRKLSIGTNGGPFQPSPIPQRTRFTITNPFPDPDDLSDGDRDSDIDDEHGHKRSAKSRHSLPHEKKGESTHHGLHPYDGVIGLGING